MLTNKTLNWSKKNLNNHLFLQILSTVIGCSIFATTAYAKKTALTQTPDPVTSYTTASGQEIFSKKLKNGLEVIVIPSKTVPIVTIEIAVKNGAYTETPQLSGLSHLFEHMFFKSNAVIPNQEAYIARVRELGISYNGTTGAERVNYFFTLPTSNFIPGLKFMYDAITSVKFDPAEFQREKEVVVGEIDRNEANPYYWFNLAISNALFSKYPNRKNPLGTRDSVRAATTKMMDTMKKNYYIPNNSALLIAGDIAPAVAFKQAEEQFGSWKKGADPFKKHKVPVHPPLSKNDYLIVTQPVNVPSFELSWHGPSVNQDPKATYAADILGTLLSQPTSTFQKKLVDSQLAYNASLSYYTQAHVGPISASIVTPPDKLFDAIKALIAQLKQMNDPSYFSEEAIKNAKTKLLVSDIYSQEKPSDFIHSVSFFWAVSSLAYEQSYISEIQKVTAQDLSNFVKKYIDNKHFVAALLTNQELAKSFGYTEEALKKVIEEAFQQASPSQTPATKQ